MMPQPMERSLWEEHQTVNVSDGIYSVVLGTGSTTVGTLDTSLFSSDDRWFEIVVDADVLTPRQPVTSVAFALNADMAGNAVQLNGETPETYVNIESINDLHGDTNGNLTIAQGTNVTISSENNTITISAIGSPLGNSISTSELENDSVTSIKIQDGAITASDIADGTITTTDLNFIPIVGPIENSNLADNSITSNKIASSAVTNSDLADNSITSSKIADGTITEADLSFTPLANPYTGNLEVVGDVSVTDDIIISDEATVVGDLNLGGNHSFGSGDARIFLDDEDDATTIVVDSSGSYGENEGQITFYYHPDDPSSGYSAMWLYLEDGGGAIKLFNRAGGINETNVELYGNYDGTGNGRILVNGSQVNDYAEYFDLTEGEQILPGMVVVIDPEIRGNLEVSTEAYDKKVAGIISSAGDTMPGMTIGEVNETNEDKPLAVSGRVYCYVDATLNPVGVGDLLTTSNTPGHAMKAANFKRAQGSIVGKAMEPLAGGKGLILVLVTLQ